MHGEVCVTIVCPAIYLKWYSYMEPVPDSSPQGMGNHWARAGEPKLDLCGLRGKDTHPTEFQAHPSEAAD